MKNLLFIFLFFGLKAASQTAFPLYLPGSSSTDSIKQVVNVNGASRLVYNIDLIKYRAALTARDTASALRLLIAGNTSNISANTTAIGLKADKSATISINGSSQTLGSNPTFTVSGGSATDTTSLSRRINRKQRVYNVEDYGAVHDGTTNDQAAIQAAINACDAAGGGTVYFPNGTYILSGALQTSVSGTNPNSQLYIPSHAITSSARTGIIFRGESNNHAPSGFSSLVLPLQTTGVILISTITGSGYMPSVIGTIGSTGNYQNYNYTDVAIQNISVRTYTNNGTSAPTLSGINLQYAAKLTIDNVSVSTDVTNQNTVSPVNSEVVGIFASGVNNDGPNELRNSYVSGYKYGYILGEHTIISNTSSACNYYGYVFPSIFYAVTGMVQVYACPFQFYFPNSTIFGITKNKARVNLNVEAEIDSTNYLAGKWYKLQKQVIDSGNYAYGILRFQTSMAYTGADYNDSISVYGGAGLNIQDYDGKYRTNQIFVAGSTGNVTGNLTGNITGGSATTSSLIYKTTTAAGTTGADHIFQVGNNGATEAMRILNNGNVGIGTNNPGQLLHIKSAANTNVFSLLEASSAGVSAQSAFRVQNDLGTVAQMGLYSSTHAAYGIMAANLPFLYSSSTAGLAVVSDANAPIIFAAGTGAIERMRITGTGGITFPSTNTAAGTTGAQTISKPTGSVNFAAGATTLVVTNTLATATSNIFVQVEGTDATATSARVTKAAGSFTITLNAAATAETRVSFWVIN